MLYLLLVLLSLVLIPVIGSEFIPKTDVNSFEIDITLEEGTSLEHTNRVTTQIEEIIMTSVGDEIEKLYTRVGPATESLNSQAQSFFEDENTAFIQVFLKEERKLSTDQIISSLNDIFRTVTDYEFQFSKEFSSLQK